MKVLGLEIAVNQAQLIVLGRLSVALLLFLFCMHGISNFLSLVTTRISSQNDREEGAVDREIQKIESEIEEFGKNQQQYDPEPWERWSHDEKVKRDARLSKASQIEMGFNVFKKSFLEYGLVLGVATIAALKPTLISTVVSVLSN